MTSLDQTFSALADPTRRTILSQLARGETALSDIARPFKMTQTGVTRHVTVLAEAGLVAVTKRGRTRYCRLQAVPMKAASDWLSDYQQFWNERMEDLARHLGETG